jgi:integrase
MYRGRPLGADTSGRSWGYQRQGGYPPKMLQEIMGHARMTTTLDLYGHLYPDETDLHADRLDDAAAEADAAK